MEVRRWSKRMVHPIDRRAFKLITFLPKDISRHFVNASDDDLFHEDSLNYMLDLIAVYVGIRPGDEATEFVNQIWDNNLRGKDEPPAAWLIRQNRKFMMCRTALGFEIPTMVKIKLLENGARFTERQRDQFIQLTHGKRNDLKTVMEVINTLDLAARRTATASTSRTYAIDATDNFPCVLIPPGFPSSTNDSSPSRR